MSSVFEGTVMNALVRINWIARGGLAFMFAYHGLVPKLLWLSDGERTMIQAHGIEQVQLFVTLAGLARLRWRYGSCFHRAAPGRSRWRRRR